MGSKQLHGESGADPSGTGTTRLTPPHAGNAGPDAGVRVVRVIIEGNGSLDGDTGFNVQLGGSQIFSTEQTYAQATDPTPQTYYPDQNEYTSDEQAALDFQVTTADPTTGTVDVTVETEDLRE